MAIGIWVVVSLLVLTLVVVGLLIWKGNGPGIIGVLGAIWNSNIGRHILLAIAVILSFEAISSYTEYNAQQKASEWLTSYNGTATTDAVGPIKATAPGLIQGSSPSPTPTAAPTATSTPTPSPTAEQSQALTTSGNAGGSSAPTPTPTPTPSPTPTQVEQKRIEAQLRIIQDRSKHHGTVMAYFYVNYFVSIVMVMVAGLVVAITLFFIAQGGWTGTNTYVRTVFIIASATAAFYGLFPPVFQQQKNITDNKELFLKYKSLESEVDSYPITLLNLNGEPKLPREFINHIDHDMAQLGDIALGFDITKVSYQEAINLQTAKPTPSPTASPSPSPTKKP